VYSIVRNNTLAEMFKLPKMLLANLLIARVMCRFYSQFNLEI
jgi:hypothetical protein